MSKLHLPYIKLPREFTLLLKSNLSVITSPSAVFDHIRHNRGLYQILENSFKEFDDGRGVEKLLTALGWANFRDRMASLYVYKSIFGDFPAKTNMELVEDIKKLEATYTDHSVNGYSRLFLLGFYMRLANIQIQTLQEGSASEVLVPDDISFVLNLSQGRTEKIDWLILILIHLTQSLGQHSLMTAISTGKKLNEIYNMMPNHDRENMHKNLLAYGASINEADFFLYEKV